MGAWGCDPFGNDTGCDWVYDLEESEGLSFIAETLDKIQAAGNSYTEDLDQWVANHPITPPKEMLNSAVRAIDRILTKPSELLELWSESGKFGDWQKHLTDLQQRLK